MRETKHNSGWKLLDKIAAFSLGLAFALTPVALKLPGVPASVVPADILLLAGAAAAAPTLLRWAVSGELIHIIGGAGPLLAWCAVSASSASDIRLAAKDLLQVAFYVVVGSGLSRIAVGERSGPRILRVGAACAFSLGLLACFASGGVGDAVVWGDAPVKAAIVLVSYATLGALLPPKSFRVGFWLMAGAAASAIAFAACALEPNLQSGQKNGAKAEVPQQLLEIYAGLSASAHAPLTGVGLGNYQEHIGEYYQGMPKDNTLTPGTGIGYTIMAASCGIPAVGAYLYWLHTLWARARSGGKPRMRWAVTAIAAAACWTPILVSSFLLPLVILNGVLAQEPSSDA